jgi:hypothetical protein
MSDLSPTAQKALDRLDAAIARVTGTAPKQKVEVANFKKEQLTGAMVATILDNENEVLEVLKRSDGKYDLIVHNRRGETDQWDDFTVTLKPAHFAVLGTIAIEST